MDKLPKTLANNEHQSEAYALFTTDNYHCSKHLTECICCSDVSNDSIALLVSLDHALLHNSKEYLFFFNKDNSETFSQLIYNIISNGFHIQQGIWKNCHAYDPIDLNQNIETQNGPISNYSTSHFLQDNTLEYYNAHLHL